MSEAPPIRPVNGRILVEELDYKPSKMIELITEDRAEATEAIVRAVSPKKHGRRKIRRGGWENTDVMLDHDVKVGDRIIMRGKYQDDDLITVNGTKFRILDPWEVEAIIDKPQPVGWEHPLTGQMLPDKHPLIGA